MREGLDQNATMRQAIKRISEYNVKEVIPEPYMLSNALSFVLRHHLDPYDSVLLAPALGTDMDAIISRDRKLKKKAAALITVLTPEEFLSKTP